MAVVKETGLAPRPMKMAVYGAGAIGRGFIGAVFANAGYEITFIDIDRELVGELNRQGCYTTLVAEEPGRSFRVSGVRAVLGSDEDAAAAAIADCDIMATSVGAAALPRIAHIIAKGFTLRAKRDREAGGASGAVRPLDILICENVMRGAKLLSDLILPYLDKETLKLAESSLGFVETVIGRMAPSNVSFDDRLLVAVEAYDYLPANSAAFRGAIPEVPQLIAREPFLFYEESKLYLHNMAHCVCAYLGIMSGYKYIWQAVADPTIRLVVKGAMEEAGAMLSIEHKTPYAEFLKRSDDLLLRFSNRALNDSCERVARDPARKIGADDRLAAPLRRCMAQGIAAVNIAVGLAAVFSAMDLSKETLGVAMRDVCNIDGDAADAVGFFYSVFAANGASASGGCRSARGLPEGLVALIDARKRALSGSVI